jgi:hypothetical protein
MASAQKLVSVPTLTDLLSDPATISAVPKDAIAELRGQIAKLDTLLLSRLLISEVLLINRYDPDADLFDYGAVFLAKQDHP